ncbi:hypothetical protein [Lacinutrix neustonica]|uniref:hypothetical protein n=1 Tax=Lacinutrix neustonica TaxID=2980107 RepID=UPI0028BE6AEA|nr:hypothetical protein [Lacinutrix neustonica]
MENLNNYQELFSKRGGHFEVLGLDLHDTDSKHPFALRRLLPVPNMIKKSLTRRQTSIEELAEKYALNYKSIKQRETHFLDNFLFFRTKKINYIYNQLNSKNGALNAFDIEFSEGEFIAKEVMRSTMLHIKLNKDIPEFTLDREGFLEKVYAFAGFKDIPIDNHSDFSRHFYLLGEDTQAIQAFFTDKITHFFENNPYYHVESNGNDLLIFGRERLASIQEIEALYDFGRRLKAIVS